MIRMAHHKYQVVGLMSGTSLDGLDLTLCKFQKFHRNWQYEILYADTYEYSAGWKQKLTKASDLDARDFILLHQTYGQYLGDAVNRFLGNHLNAELVASHGHTVFHQPESGLTFQLGDGAALASCCGITTVSDFRTLNVAMGGQGAPLVPLGDELLFGEYDACLNLGGFANISYRHENTRIAFDICPVNIILNRLAGQQDLDYDPDGRLGRAGKSNEKLVNQLNDLAYYTKEAPKSLGREWLEQYFIPALNQSGIDLQDKLRSVYEHIFYQIGRCIKAFSFRSILVTGGGVCNGFLLEGLKKTGARLIIPDERLIRYKEALIFAFLGLLRYRNEVNSQASATGSRKDLSTGIIHLV